jgi:hypothetical protein
VRFVNARGDGNQFLAHVALCFAPTDAQLAGGGVVEEALPEADLPTVGKEDEREGDSRSKRTLSFPSMLDWPTP